MFYCSFNNDKEKRVYPLNLLNSNKVNLLISYNKVTGQKKLINIQWQLVSDKWKKVIIIWILWFFFSLRNNNNNCQYNVFIFQLQYLLYPDRGCSRTWEPGNDAWLHCTIFTHTLTYMGNLDLPNPPLSIGSFWELGGNLRTQKSPKGHRENKCNSNQGPWSFAKAMHLTPLELALLNWSYHLTG